MTNPDNTLPAPSAERSSEPNPVANPVRTQPGKNGGTLKVGGTNPGSGRPPDAWKALCADMADRGAKAALAKKVLDDPEHPAWLGAWKFVAEQAHGKAAQTIKGDPDQPLRFEVIRERKRRERADD